MKNKKKKGAQLPKILESCDLTLRKLFTVCFCSCQREREYNTALYHSHFVRKLAVRVARKK